jgi:ubiquitin-conjugating enzyme E2 variant
MHVDGKVSVLANWSRENTIETILVELRKEMASFNNRKFPQPPGGVNLLKGVVSIKL